MEKLTRSRKNKVISGVCGGLGNYFHIDPVVIRIIAVLGIFTVPPFFFIGYILLWIVLPLESQVEVIGPSSDGKPEIKTNKEFRKWLSIIFAIILIFIGIFFLVPGSWTRIFDLSAVIMSLMFLLIGVKFGYDCIINKEYSLVRLSIGCISITLSVFLILTTFNILKTGIYFEYFKYLMPAILIICGIGLIIKQTSLKLIGIIISLILYLTVGIFSITKSNYDILGIPHNMFKEMFNWTYINKSGVPFSKNLSDTLSLKEKTDKISYRLQNSGGALSVSGTSNLLEYTVYGVPPKVNVTRADSSYSVDFQSQASHTTALINTNIRIEINAKVAGGHLEADLRNVKLQTLTLKVDAGNAAINIAPETRDVKINVNAGRADIQIPKKSRVRLKYNSSMAGVGIPQEFTLENGQYIYNGGGETEILIDASVNMGNLSFSIE